MVVAGLCRPAVVGLLVLGCVGLHIAEAASGSGSTYNGTLPAPGFDSSSNGGCGARAHLAPSTDQHRVSYSYAL
eukprot:COSAG02_NODE_483_length_21396_cov_20.544801_15_plen_74_part_00